jgi:hypothetical protein
MACYPQSAAGLGYITYPVGPTTTGVTLTASASANTKGSYTEIAASSSFACTAVQVHILLTTSTDGLQFLTDIATGAGGAESVVIPDIILDNPINTGGSSFGSGFWVLPLAIAASTRIAGRIACSTGSSTAVIVVTLTAAGGQPGITSFTNYGSASGDSGGTAIDPGGSAETKGAYVELSASTGAIIQALTSMYSLGGNTGAQSARWAIDVATGAGGAEAVLIPDLRLSCRDIPNALSSGALMPRSHSVLTYIAASTRLAVRASCNITDATDRLFDIALLAGTAPAETSGAGGSFAFA